MSERLVKTAGKLFLASTLVIGADVLLSRQSPMTIEPVGRLRIVNINGQLFSSSTIFMRDLVTGRELPLNLNVTTNVQYSPSISPDGSQIALVNHDFTDAYNQQDYLSVMDITGRNLKNIIPYEFSGSVPTPVWLDNNTLAFLSLDIKNTNTQDIQKLNQVGISVIKTDGSGRYQFDYTFQNFKSIPAFCYDTKTNRIIFAGVQFNQPDRSDIKYEIYSINLNGTSPQRLTNIDSNLAKWGVSNMKCLKDNKISLDLAPRGYLEPYTMNFDGSNLQKVKK